MDSRRKTIEERQRREARSLREDELRLGLATLAGVYRDQLVASAAVAPSPADPAPSSSDPARAVEKIAHITAAAEALIRNPNEALL